MTREDVINDIAGRDSAVEEEVQRQNELGSGVLEEARQKQRTRNAANSVGMQPAGIGAESDFVVPDFRTGEEEERRVEPTVISGFDRAGNPKYTTRREFLQSIQMMARTGMLDNLIERLFIAGFLKGDINYYQALDVPHPDVLDAASKFFDYAVSQEAIDPTARGEHWNGILDDLVDNVIGTDLDPLGGGGGEAGQATALSNEKSLRIILEDTYQKMVGKGPSEAEQRAFVAAIHRSQRERDSLRYSVRGGNDVEYEAIDPQAEAAQFAEEERPVETEAKGIVNQAQLLRKMIAGGG